uniref:HAD family hydrolase n=1 Tax=Picosynechococcus sp. (strain ATCC 27264 / PCC 7002 / PR-6) TaxID=32049 RepID=UPI001C3D6E03
ERAARGGVLVKDRLALEAMRTVDAVLFDKTGTLTKGEPALAEIIPRHAQESEVLALAAAAEAESAGAEATADLRGRLDYLPSGEEPRLWVGSRRGVPYHS